ncbi:Major facilitator superfamily domain-containing protein 8 [Portunus trituberculatus]|uniref:Major facilitator superfamily domain-containing protein 8 n=1 Tax=Portunus trituberculatus TaxID=210409 RepID=A0A5B7ELJ3_PORTR|nr:Major facilitator superfamily domain-containing protein 8 [Portunus trituberculatus]
MGTKLSQAVAHIDATSSFGTKMRIEKVGWNREGATEYNIAKKEMAVLKQERTKDEDLKLPKLDPVALTGLLFGFFIGIFIYVLIETLAVPFVSDQYAWSDNQAQVIVGVALMAGGLLASAVFPFSGFLSRKFDERKVLLLGGFIPMIIGMLLFLPYPGMKIPRQNCTSSVTSSYTTFESSALPNNTSSFEIDNLLFEDQYVSPSNHFLIYQRLLLISATSGETDEDCTPGCPAEQEWCESVPRLPMAQLGVAFFFVMLGYPIEVSISQGLFSKMLGPKPQGLWMGVLTGIGSLGRILGPIFVSYIYTNFGTYWCFGTLSVCMLVAFFVETVIYRRLVPMKVPVPKKTQHAYDGPAAITQSNGTEVSKSVALSIDT